MKILYESTRIKNKKYNENLNNAMHKYGWVLDKYGGGGGGVVCMSLVWISSLVIFYFEEYFEESTFLFPVGIYPCSN